MMIAEQNSMIRFQEISGNDWWSNPDAPWNIPHDEYMTCPDCGGDGGVWYDADGNEYSVADYERMSEECRAGMEFDKCERCEGVGTILVD